jgi:hypothetical protein
VDETRLEMGRAVTPPTRRALAMAVIANPYAGRYSENLDELIATQCKDLTHGEHICSGNYADPVLTVDQAELVRLALHKALRDTLDGLVG